MIEKKKSSRPVVVIVLQRLNQTGHQSETMLRPRATLNL